MGLAHLILDLDELRPKRRYADWGSIPNPDGSQPNNGNPPAGSYPLGPPVSNAPPPSNNGPAVDQSGGSDHPAQWINNQGVATVNPNSYDYGGTPGGAAAFNSQLAVANQGVQNQQAAQIQNQYEGRDQGNVQNTLGGLSSFYQGQLNGTGPSLAQAQMNAATNQNIAAQMAAANSAHGSLAAAGAGMQAGQTAAGMEQNAAQQAMQGRIQEEYNAAQGMQGLGSLYEGEQGLNIGEAEQQAQLQEEQQRLAAGTGLGYAGLENQVNMGQLGAQMGEQGQMSQNYQAASGQGMQQGQFNTTQGWNEAMGGIGAGLGLVAALADADFQEPSRIGRPLTPAKSTLGPRGYADADMQPPAHLTMREERPVDDEPFLIVADQNNRTVGRVALKPLDAKERARVNEPHGAGPLFADGLARAHTVMHDAKLGTGARFSHLEHSLAARPGVHDAGALAGYIGREKYGAHKMAKLAAKGRK